MTPTEARRRRGHLCTCGHLKHESRCGKRRAGWGKPMKSRPIVQCGCLNFESVDDFNKRTGWSLPSPPHP